MTDIAPALNALELANTRMAKKILEAPIRVPDIPRVRFFILGKEKGKPAYKDVTNKVSKLVIVDLKDESGFCALLRFDPAGKLVWTTRHQSVKEAKWYAEFEYGLPEEKWTKYSEGAL